MAEVMAYGTDWPSIQAASQMLAERIAKATEEGGGVNLPALIAALSGLTAIVALFFALYLLGSLFA